MTDNSNSKHPTDSNQIYPCQARITSASCPHCDSPVRFRTCRKRSVVRMGGTDLCQSHYDARLPNRPSKNNCLKHKITYYDWNPDSRTPISIDQNRSD